MQALCLVDADGKIPIAGVARLCRVKVVKGEEDAVKVQEAFRAMHDACVKAAPGFMGSSRFVCKEHWDMNLYLRFADLDSIKAFMTGELRTGTVEPIAAELLAKGLIIDEAHWQNFVADEWKA